MDINAAAEAIDGFLRTYTGAGGRRAAEVQVRPSGDDMNAIKVWVDLGPGVGDDDCAAWSGEAEGAIRDKLGDKLGDWTLEMRTESL